MKEVWYPPSADVNFNMTEGKLIIGALALEEAIEAGHHPADIQPLGVLLSQADRPVDPTYTVPMNPKEWDSADDIPTVKMFHALIQDANPDQKSAVNEEALTRAGYLGIIPRITHFKNYPGGLQGIYAQAELRGVKMHGYFDSWSTQEYIDYVQKLARTLGRKPGHKDLVEHARVASNPGEKQIKKHFGKPSALLELAGWVNVKDWETSDYIDWGVHFMHVNEGLLPTSRHMRYVSTYSRAIGPGTDAVYDHKDFTSIMDFQTQVAEEYTKQRLFHEQTAKLLTERSEIDCEKEPAMKELLSGIDEPEKRLEIYARYVLARPLLPELAPGELKIVCLFKKTSYFVDKILQLNPKVSLGDIETIAAAQGLTNLIWPPDYTNDPLRVANWNEIYRHRQLSNEQLGAERQHP